VVPRELEGLLEDFVERHNDEGVRVVLSKLCGILGWRGRQALTPVFK
jgi:hypothetical protein